MSRGSDGVDSGSGGEGASVPGERFEVLEVIGEGALGRTYLARDASRDGQPVAVKEFLPHQMKSWKNFELFERECRTLRGLDHPGIPDFYDNFVVEGDGGGAAPRAFLVQEYIDGATLASLIEDGAPFEEQQVRELAVEVLRILDYLHGHQPPVVHRDIKPSNLIRTPDGRVVLIDFGAVQDAVASRTDQTLVGTFGYMPPEQYTGRVDPGADIFALGATCIHLLTGRSPDACFDGLDRFVLPEDLEVTVGFERLLLRMTDPDPERRLASAARTMREMKTGFLMVPRDSVTGGLPIPNEIEAPPRSFPGFQLRDPRWGYSHLSVLLWGVASVLLTLPLIVALLAAEAFVWVGPALVVTAIAGGFGLRAGGRALRDIEIFRRGRYTLGEVEGRYLDADGDGVHLTYRYRVGDGFRRGELRTRDEAVAASLPGEPMGVVYLEEQPDEHIVYTVPADWSEKGTEFVGRTRPAPRLAEEGGALDGTGSE